MAHLTYAPAIALGAGTAQTRAALRKARKDWEEQQAFNHLLGMMGWVPDFDPIYGHPLR